MKFTSHRCLQIYAFAITFVCGGIVFRVLAPRQAQTRFGEIDVERINIVEKDGKLKMAISNKERLPDNVVAGETMVRKERSPGILFYTDEGDECGGLIFGGQKREGNVDAFGSLTFDQYQQDQTLQLTYSDSKGYRLVGLRVKDRPDIPLPEHVRRIQEVEEMKDGPEKTAAWKPLRAPDRVFVGKSGENAAVSLFDPQGRPRIKMAVDGSGIPRLEFLDATGKVTYRLPEVSNSPP